MKNRQNFWRNMLMLCAVFVFVLNLFSMQFISVSARDEASRDIPPIQTNMVAKEEASIILKPTKCVLVEFDNLADLEKALQKSEKREAAARSMKESALALGYDVNHPVVVLATEEIRLAIASSGYYKSMISRFERAQKETLWTSRSEEYPVATYIWQYLKNLGYNDYVCAGILGNMMTESGGQTFNIQPEIYDGTGYYYGICQWSKEYYPEVHRTDLQTQLNFLAETIESEINIFGDGYDNFLSITDAQTAAIAFAAAYERCAPSTYIFRAESAIVAYDYFAK